jgi:hypothetical protein
MSGGVHLHMIPDDAPCRGALDPYIITSDIFHFISVKFFLWHRRNGHNTVNPYGKYELS